MEKSAYVAGGSCQKGRKAEWGLESREGGHVGGSLLRVKRVRSVSWGLRKMHNLEGVSIRSHHGEVLMTLTTEIPFLTSTKCGARMDRTWLND